jgi:hypothetical protein
MLDSMPALESVSDSFESLDLADVRRRGPYLDAQRWIEFVGEGTRLSPLELVEEGIDCRACPEGHAFRSCPFPPRYTRDLLAPFVYE